MRTLGRVLALLMTVVVLAAAAPLVPGLLPASESDRIAWRAELARLEQHLAGAYANFEWTVRHRELDLPALHRAADSSLAAASSRHAARKAFRRLIAAFDDGHLSISPPDHPLIALAHRVQRGGSAAIEAGTMADAACRRLGYSRDAGGFEIPFDKLPGYRSVRTAPFRAGLMAHAGQVVGIVRIAQFGEDRYGADCEAVWDSVRAGAAGACDETCEDAVWQAVGNRLVASFAQTVGLLADSGASALLVDVTGNGGGTNLADALARELAGAPLHGNRTGMIRHPHSVAALRHADSLVAADLARAGLPPEQRRLLESSRQTIARLTTAAEATCDATPLWQARAAACSPLLEDSTYSTGLLTYAAPGALASLESAGVLFAPSRYRYREGAWRGPVFVLIDARSASATEQFAGLLSDNSAATLLGERSYGAGCDYTNGGVTLELPHVGMSLRAPDCARLRASGANERSGIAPDVAIGWQGLKGSARAAAVLDAMH